MRLVPTRSGTLEDVLAVICPGQGAQAPGMLSPWLEMPSVAARIAASSEAAGLDLAAHGTTSDADTIRDTAVAQPLLVATALATARELLGPVTPAVAAGHSVGEFAAAALAGVLSDADAMRLVAVRARRHGRRGRRVRSRPRWRPFSAESPTRSSRPLAELGLTPANINGGGQVVAAGTKAAIARLVAAPPARARVIELQVAGAFHTSYMAPAVATLGAAAADVAVADPRAILLSNADGTPVATGAEAMRRMVAQVANPVRWDLCQESHAGDLA